MDMYCAHWSAWTHSRRRDLEQLAYNMMENVDDRKKKAIEVAIKYDVESSIPVFVKSAKLVEMKDVEKEHSMIYTHFMFNLNCIEKHDKELTCCLFLFQVEDSPDEANNVLSIEASVHYNLWDLKKPTTSQEAVLKIMNSESKETS